MFSFFSNPNSISNEFLIPNSNYKNSPYFPKLSQEEIKIFNDTVLKVSQGFVVVYPNTTKPIISIMTPDWKLADAIYLEQPFDLIPREQVFK